MANLKFTSAFPACPVGLQYSNWRCVCAVASSEGFLVGESTDQVRSENGSTDF